MSRRIHTTAVPSSSDNAMEHRGKRRSPSSLRPWLVRIATATTATTICVTSFCDSLSSVADAFVLRPSFTPPLASRCRPDAFGRTRRRNGPSSLGVIMDPMEAKSAITDGENSNDEGKKDQDDELVASAATDYLLQTEDFSLLTRRSFFHDEGDDDSLDYEYEEYGVEPFLEHEEHEPVHLKADDDQEGHVQDKDQDDGAGSNFLSLPKVSNLSVPQIHLPPRFVPDIGWEYHHQATDRLRQERENREEEKRRMQREGRDDNESEGGNPVSAFVNMIKNRPRLVSSTAEWKRLQKHAGYTIANLHLRDLMQDNERCDSMFVEHDGVYLDYSRQRMTQETMQLLLDLAEKQDLAGKMRGMVTGEKINFTEERAVLHTALRELDRSKRGSIMVDGTDCIAEVQDVLDQVKAFTEGVRSGEIRGYTGKRLRNIVSVGIGGSYLGPEFLHECLKTEPEGVDSALGYSLRFLSNVDPVDVERTCADLDPEETLVVIVSKTFTTAETMLNARTMRQWLWDFMGNDENVVRKHMVACSSISAADKVREFGIDTDEYFFRFWDWVGGRYSVCSAAGAVPISLLYGFDLFEKFLQGAHSMDEHFLNAPFDKNIPVIMGLLGVWNMSFLKYSSRTTLPYAEALLKLPAHIQQLDMESNGKTMTRQGLQVDYPVGEIDFGEAGTNGQHSFYQLLHMGQTVPCDFIGFAESQHDFCLDDKHLSSHDELMANFFAQPDALATGKTEDEVRAEGVPEDQVPHRVFKGNRPSLSLLLPKLTAHACGQLLALYEHRTAVQGFLWDINSFDQWGVELGKKLALQVKGHLLEARRDGENGKSDGGPPQVKDAGNPATTRLLNHYLKASRGGRCSDGVCDDPASTGNSFTRVTRKTHREHSQFPPPPPVGHDGEIHN